MISLAEFLELAADDPVLYCNPAKGTNYYRACERRCLTSNFLFEFDDLPLHVDPWMLYVDELIAIRAMIDQNNKELTRSHSFSSCCSSDDGSPAPSDEKSLRFSDAIFDINLDPGPFKLPVLTIRIRSGKLNADTVKAPLGCLCSWISDGTLLRDFVGIYDIADMSLPSVFGLPQFLKVYGKISEQLSCFATHQLLFGVVRGSSKFFNTLIDACVKLSKCDTKPVFGTNQRETLEGLAHALCEHFPSRFRISQISDDFIFVSSGRKRASTSSFGSCASLELELSSMQYTRCKDAPPDSDALSSIGAPVESASQEDVSYCDELCALNFHRYGGPFDLPLFTVHVRRVAINASSVKGGLDTVYAWIRHGILLRDFVAIFDLSELLLPSIVALPRLLQIFKQNVENLNPFSHHQLRFAVIRGNSKLFNKLLDTCVKLSGCTTKPIFALDRDDALQGLRRGLCELNPIRFQESHDADSPMLVEDRHSDSFGSCTSSESDKADVLIE